MPIPQGFVATFRLLVVFVSEEILCSFVPLCLINTQPLCLNIKSRGKSPDVLGKVPLVIRDNHLRMSRNRRTFAPDKRTRCITLKKMKIMKKIMIMMVMMLTIVVSTSGKNNTSVTNDRNMRNDRNVTVIVHDGHNHQRPSSWRGKAYVCKCKCHKFTPCCGKPTPPCKKCVKQMRKGKHPMPRR